MDIDWDSVIEVALLGVGMSIVASILWVAYRTMDHPRLPVIREPGLSPRVTWPGVARYAILTPLLVMFWVIVLLMLIIAVAQQRSPEQILAAACAVIAGARLLAHINREIAHELAKTVPIVILSVVIIGGQLAGLEKFEQTFNAIPWEQADSYVVGLIVWDYLLTFLWFWLQRHQWQRRDRPAGPLKRARARWRRIGYATSRSD